MELRQESAKDPHTVCKAQSKFNCATFQSSRDLHQVSSSTKATVVTKTVRAQSSAKKWFLAYHWAFFAPSYVCIFDPILCSFVILVCVCGLSEITVLYCTHSFLQWPLMPPPSSVVSWPAGGSGAAEGGFVWAYSMQYSIVQSSQWDRAFDLRGVHLSSLSLFLLLIILLLSLQY